MSLDTSRGLRTIGNYELISMIAEGGMGAVHRGRHRETGEIVAIKIVPQETARNPLLLKRFEQEFKAASLIDHPNVVKALDYCGTGPTPFLVMEFVDGESLGQRVEREGAYPEAEAVRLTGMVCEGLHRAHKQGLIHRDVKPDNIMVTLDGVAKLTDLGLVKDVEGELNLTRTGRGLGTPYFMAPEQFRNAKNADVRCDVYSLGATLYTLLTGVVPFEKTSPLDCWMKKTKNDFPTPKSLAPGLSERVDWAVCRAMSSDPARRPASCREFMEDLTGTRWRVTAPGASDSLLLGPPPTEDLWYLVYRDAAGQLHTVKGATASVRRNISGGSLGDVAAILVSRTKTGQFLPLRNVPEFRDLVISPFSAGMSPLNQLVNTTFVPPRGGSGNATPRTADAVAAGASGTRLAAPGTPTRLPQTTPTAGVSGTRLPPQPAPATRPKSSYPSTDTFSTPHPALDASGATESLPFVTMRTSRRAAPRKFGAAIWVATAVAAVAFVIVMAVVVVLVLK
ncbi:serine/threonine protein kinase [Fimbriiglobus ruber]|uniref:Serine/threonine protein kinase PrkC, regulator of stationary phase n=1 Tax=Fimbriiglobus ruber TaxID=1908690 RepID=A0A225E2U3_9BACT|nr:serine/threonine-protein kinase [Fimbriiglobus ruber]OWK42995.1 Serine/threonine protein kinase PrkC, regulator of stationary phase [Fimbriiglobus ruber]